MRESFSSFLLQTNSQWKDRFNHASASDVRNAFQIILKNKDLVELAMEYGFELGQRRTGSQLKNMKNRRGICEISLLSIPMLAEWRDPTFEVHSPRFTTVYDAPSCTKTLEDIENKQRHTNRKDLERVCLLYSKHFYVYDCGHAVYEIALMYGVFHEFQSHSSVVSLFDKFMKQCYRCQRKLDPYITPLHEFALQVNQLRIGDVLDSQAYRGLGYYIYEGLIQGHPTFLRVPVGEYYAIWPLYYLKLRGYAYYEKECNGSVDAWLFPNGYAYSVGFGFEEWNKREEFMKAANYRMCPRDRNQHKTSKKRKREESKQDLCKSEHDPSMDVVFLKNIREWTPGKPISIPVFGGLRFQVGTHREITITENW